MVNLLNKNDFVYLLAKRNIKANKKTTAVIIITLSLVFAMFILMLGIREIYRDIFTKEAQNRYPNIDIVISYDEYSSARFINKRQLEEEYENIDYALAFFNLQVLSISDELNYYSNMHSALPNEFELFLDIDVNLLKNETIITKSYSEEFDLEIGDSIYFYILDESYEYKVKDIVPDKGIFSGNSFFVDKGELLSSIYGLNYLDNFGNKIYIKTQMIDSVYDRLISDSFYNDYSIKLVIDEERIEGLISEYISMVALAGMIVLISLVIVLNSLFIIVLRDIFEEIGVFETLGDTKKLGYIVCLVQWLIYIAISFVIAIILAHTVVGIGASIYGIKEFILINPIVIFSSLLIIVILIIFKNLLLIKKYYKKNSIDRIRDKRQVSNRFNYFASSIVLVILLVVGFVKPFSIKYNALIIVILSIYLSLNILVFAFKLIKKVFMNRKTSFSMFNTKHMGDNKNMHQSLSVIFIAFIVVAIMFTVKGFISNQISKVKEDNLLDIVMTNIYNYEDSLLDEIHNYDVSNVNPAFYYNNVLATTNNENNFLIKMFVSIAPLDFNKYFGYKLSSVDEYYVNHDLPYIMFPKSYEIVHNLSVGDIVNLDLGPKTRSMDFIVAGYIDTDFDQVAYTNLVDKLDIYGLQYNAIVINSDNHETTISQLIKDYSGKMYYLVDAQKTVDDQLNLAGKVLSLFSVIIVFVVLSFIFVVFNNTLLKFYALRNDYSKVKILGISNREIFANLIKELALTIVVLLVIGIVELIVLSNYLKYVLLFFDYYKELTASVIPVSFAYLLIIISLLISYIYYYKKIKHIVLSQEIRML